MTPTAQQRAIINRVRSGCNLSVNAGPGTGKGLRSDQPVITPTGFIPIGNLHIGDMVYGPDGNCYPVIGVYRRGELPLYKIEFNDGQSVITDGDHRWLCKTLQERKKNHNAVIRTTAELIELNKNVFLPMPKPLIGNQVDQDIDPWLFGAILGDGCISERSIRFSNSEESMLSAVKDSLPDSCCLKYSKCYDWAISRIGNRNPVVGYFRNLDMLGCRSHEKFIPERLLNADILTRISILQGLLDTDGYTDGHCVEYSSSSKQLALDVIRIVESLGGLCKMKVKPSHYTKSDGSKVECRLSYRIVIRLPAEISPFRNSKKKLIRYIPKTKYQPARQIVSITPDGVGESVCIEVGSPDHLFLTVGHAVTHNTATNGMVAKASTDKNIVNFCFNRSTKLQADQKMPAHVKNYTFHGAAYTQIGKYYAGKLNVKLQPNVIAGRFGCDARTAMLAKYTLRRYALSDDGAIMGWHVPREAVLAVDEKDRNAFKDEVVTLAKKTWYACMNHKDRSFGIEHDFYLKQWVEEGARLPGKFQLGLVDEAQDMVPINIKAINRMRFEQTVLTGDPKQELYLWRGGQDAMRAMGYDELPLTLSHRFGPAIADIANQVIDLFPEQHHHLTGDAKIDSSICYGSPSDPHVVLCRSNAGLLGETVNAVRKGKRIHVVGSIFDSILLMESAWYLSIGEKAKVKHPTMAMIGDWNAALELATEDTEIAQAVKRVDEYGGQIPSLVDELRCAGETSRDRADVVLSTVHKFKGDEADVVKLGDDFPDLVRWSKKDRAYIPLKGELCVFFVAVTRARRKLYANRTLEQLKVWKELL